MNAARQQRWRKQTIRAGGLLTALGCALLPMLPGRGLAWLCLYFVVTGLAAVLLVVRIILDHTAPQNQVPSLQLVHSKHYSEDN